MPWNATLLHGYLLLNTANALGPVLRRLQQEQQAAQVCRLPAAPLSVLPSAILLRRSFAY
jgi:hypothetical protein